MYYGGQLRTCGTDTRSADTSLTPLGFILIDDQGVTLDQSVLAEAKPIESLEDVENEPWILDEAINAQKEGVRYYNLRKEMLDMQEALHRQCKAGNKDLNAAMALKVQSLPDAHESDEATQPTHDHIKQDDEDSHPMPLRRPGPDVDDSESSSSNSNNSLAADTTPRSRRRASLQPRKPVRGPCQCCFEEISTHNYISCTVPEPWSSHIFCKDCVRRYVQEWVFGGADYQLIEITNTLPCMAIDCANGHMPHSVIQGVCSDALWEHYQEKVFRMEAIATMPPSATLLREDAAHAHAFRSRSDPPAVHIDLRRAVSREETSSDAFSTVSRSDPPAVHSGLGRDDSFDNPSRTVLRRRSFSDHEGNPYEQGSTRRGERSQPTKRKEGDLNESVHKVAEAMTHAKIRRCPMCAVSFLKESGCNKMKCPSCRTYMCYICRLPVDRFGYDHFCQHAYDSCRKCSRCPLWTRRDEENDQQRIYEVATNEANRLWEKALLQSAPGASGASLPDTVVEMLQAENPKQESKGTGRTKWLRRLKKK